MVIMSLPKNAEIDMVADARRGNLKKRSAKKDAGGQATYSARRLALLNTVCFVSVFLVNSSRNA